MTAGTSEKHFRLVVGDSENITALLQQCYLVSRYNSGERKRNFCARVGEGSNEEMCL